MKLGEAGRQYQDALEHARLDPDDEELSDTLDQARRTMVAAWLEALHAKPSTRDEP